MSNLRHVVIVQGGKGSGNFGHKGRKGTPDISMDSPLGRKLAELGVKMPKKKETIIVKRGGRSNGN